MANVRIKNPLKNAKNWKIKINATRRRYGRNVWRLANDVQVVQAIKCLIPTTLRNVSAQETLSLIPIIYTNVYAQATKFQTIRTIVSVFVLPIRFLTSITHPSVSVTTVNYPTWPGNAVNLIFYMTCSKNVSNLHCKYILEGIITNDNIVILILSQQPCATL